MCILGLEENKTGISSITYTEYTEILVLLIIHYTIKGRMSNFIEIHIFNLWK